MLRSSKGSLDANASAPSAEQVAEAWTEELKTRLDDVVIGALLLHRSVEDRVAAAHAEEELPVLRGLGELRS